MRTLLLLLVSGLLLSCTSQRLISYTVQTEPAVPLTPAPQKVIVLNTFDPTSSPKRKNIEQLNSELIDGVLQNLASVINRRMGISAEPVTGLTQLSPQNNPVGLLLQQHQATHAIVITLFDVAFEKTDVEVTRTSSGKSREAYYDICNTINFEVYNRDTLLDKSSTPVCQPHSSRMVISGLLAAGPSYKANQEDFARLSYDNSLTFLRRHFPGEVHKTRPVFIGGEFKTVTDCLARKDYEAALAENRRLAENPKPRIAAMALYNCAVLSERKSDLKAAHRYLHESFNKILLPQATEMDMQFEGLPD